MITITKVKNGKGKSLAITVYLHMIAKHFGMAVEPYLLGVSRYIKPVAGVFQVEKCHEYFVNEDKQQDDQQLQAN